MRCNCESSFCTDHDAGDCHREADGAARADYVGELCEPCAKTYPPEYIHRPMRDGWVCTLPFHGPDLPCVAWATDRRVCAVWFADGPTFLCERAPFTASGVTS